MRPAPAVGYGLNEAEGPGSRQQLQQKGETDPIIKYVRELLDNKEWRTIFYASLIALAIFPIFVDAVDVFNKDSLDKYTGNEFCNEQRECAIAVSGCGMIMIALFVLVRTTLYTEYTEPHSRVKNMCVALLLIGGGLLVLTILMMTAKAAGGASNEVQYLSECYLWTEDGTGYRNLCCFQYFGQQLIYPLITFCAAIDFANLWSGSQNRRYSVNRMIWFSLALFIASLAVASNLIVNHKIYERHILANTSYYTCTLGYCLIVLVSSGSFLLQCRCFENWRTERTFTRMMGYMTLLAVLLVQSRTFADLFVFCCMCLVLAADIQVVNE